MTSGMDNRATLEECREALHLVFERIGIVRVPHDGQAAAYLHSARRDCSMAREHIARALEEISDPIEVSYFIVR